MNFRRGILPVVGSTVGRAEASNGATELSTPPNTRFITGSASTSDQMLHRMNIETQMPSANMGLMQTPTLFH